MEKIIRHIILFFGIMSLQTTIYSQEWLTSLNFEHGNKSIFTDTMFTTTPTIAFPTRNYENSFDLRTKSIKGFGTTIGVNNDLMFNKNIITTQISIGFSSYQYNMQLYNRDSLDIASSDSLIAPMGDSDIWKKIINDKQDEFTISKLYPALRFGIGYKRELLLMRGVVPQIDAGFMLEKRFSLKDYNDSLYVGRKNETTLFLPNKFNHKNLLISSYIGFSLRFNSNTFGARYTTTFGRVDNKVGAINFTEASLQFYYSRSLGLSKLSKEQIIYDEYQYLKLSKSAEYRRGDRFHYYTYSFANNGIKQYENKTQEVSTFIDKSDTLTRVVLGNTVTPNMGFDLSFNTFTTHRLMMGFGFGFYEESYNAYGYTYDSTTNQKVDFGPGDKPSKNENIYAALDKQQRLDLSFNTAYYFSKKILPVDPYLKGGAAMVMVYDAPDFLTNVDSWGTTAFFSIYKIGLGIDFRARYKSSKYIVIGAGIDYIINPHKNYIQYSIRIGRYKKKKLKNQDY